VRVSDGRSQRTPHGLEAGGAGLPVLLGLPVGVEQGVQRGRLLALGQAVERSAADVQHVETLRVRGGQQLPRLVPQGLEGGHLRQRGGDLVEWGQVAHAAPPCSPLMRRAIWRRWSVPKSAAYSSVPSSAIRDATTVASMSSRSASAAPTDGCMRAMYSAFQ